jgi:hypothetical protein
MQAAARSQLPQSSVIRYAALETKGAQGLCHWLVGKTVRAYTSATTAYVPVHLVRCEPPSSLDLRIHSGSCWNHHGEVGSIPESFGGCNRAAVRLTNARPRPTPRETLRRRKCLRSQFVHVSESIGNQVQGHLMMRACIAANHDPGRRSRAVPQAPESVHHALMLQTVSCGRLPWRRKRVVLVLLRDDAN